MRHNEYKWHTASNVFNESAVYSTPVIYSSEYHGNTHEHTWAWGKCQHKTIETIHSINLAFLNHLCNIFTYHHKRIFQNELMCKSVELNSCYFDVKSSDFPLYSVFAPDTQVSVTVWRHWKWARSNTRSAPLWASFWSCSKNTIYSIYELIYSFDYLFSVHISQLYSLFEIQRSLISTKYIKIYFIVPRKIKIPVSC